MSMQAESLEVLEKANLSSTQARAIVRAIEIEIAGAKDVGRQIPIPELEPGVVAIPLDHREGVERLLRKPPSALFVGEIRERVDDGVDVRGDVEAPVLEVVPRVDDDGERLRGQDP